MKKLLPILLPVLGLVGGVVGGTAFKPAESAVHGDAKAGDHGDGHAVKASDDHGDDGHGGGKDKDEYVYVGLEKPFFAPIQQGDNTGAVVRIDIHLEIPQSLEEDARKHEPKLRDAFLKAVLNFSEDGGFGRVRGSDGFSRLRDDFLVGARRVLGPEVKTVLIGEILTRDG